jgi:hypothetical protein
MATDIYTRLTQSKADLAASANGLPFNAAPALSGQEPLSEIATIVGQAVGMANAAKHRPPPGSCQQSLVLSFFFDGTGNNIDADSGTKQQSNIARLFDSHRLNASEDNLYSFYCYGIGTYFKEIGDPGGTPAGLGLGDGGKKRLDWALAKFDEKVHAAEMRAKNPTNKIISIRIAVFGFSRGATLARAFVRDLQERCFLEDGRYHLKQGGYKVEVYFLGLFDTVASIGLPMSSNNTMVGTMLRKYSTARTVNWRARAGHSGIRSLPFGEPGADPAPGSAHGHSSIAHCLRIPPIVDRCVHMVAAHEFRNSFPLDSCLEGLQYPPSVTEMVYPGAHSDLGGGYQPGEGGRSAHQAEMISMVPLLAMHSEAIKSGVPLYGIDALPRRVKPSFAADPEGQAKLAEMLDCWKHYMKETSAAGNLGEQFLAHMRQYYRWRFYTIARSRQARCENLETLEETVIKEREPGFRRERARLAKTVNQRKDELDKAHAALRTAEQRVFQAEQNQMNYGTPVESDLLDASTVAQERVALARDAYLSEKAALDTYANDSALLENAATYDHRLMTDVETIATELRRNPKLVLRPHYRKLLDAYEAEFAHGKGLRDEKLIAFFDRYVHDSLSGFALDATLPSDPRVLYVGGDDKMRYANADIGRMEQAA